MFSGSFHLWAAIAYWLVCFWALVRARQLQWLCASLVLWVAAGLLIAKLMPAMWVSMRMVSSLAPYFYLTVGSVFFFIGHWRASGNGWLADSQHPVLSLFAVSNVLMTLAFSSLLVLVGLLYPGQAAVAAGSAVLDFYAFKPVFWFAAQFVLMAVFYIHRANIMKESAARFSRRQLEGGFVLALLMQLAAVANLLLADFNEKL